jgi:DNA primase catalytic subunit
VKHTFDGKPADLKNQREIYGFDYFMDVDAESLGEAKDETTKLMDFLLAEKLEFSIRFSGSKGFHSVLEYNEVKKLLKAIEEESLIQDTYTNDETAYIFSRIKERLPELYEISTGNNFGVDIKDVRWDSEGDYAHEVAIDGAVTGTGMQLQRTPYSLHPSTLLVCYPLTKKQFEEFNTETYKSTFSIENIYKTDLKNRGIPKI